MGSIWSFVKGNYKKLLGVAVGVSGVFYPPLLPLTTSLGGVIFGSDFQHGTELGTPVGKDAKELASQLDAARKAGTLPPAQVVTTGADIATRIKSLFPKK